MNDDSTNLQPAFFGPGPPLYPLLDQLVLVTGPALPSTNPPVYPCVVIQFNPANLQSRQRTAAYVTEPNGIVLGQSIYDTRLVGAYLGIPLFAATCCAPSQSSSSSSSRSSH